MTDLGSSTPDSDTAEPSGGAAEPTGDVTPSSAQSERTNETMKVLIAYFSRAGENYFNGDRTFLEVGNTQVLAGMIGERVPCDVYRIEAVDPYPESYDVVYDRLSAVFQRMAAVMVVASVVSLVVGYLAPAAPVLVLAFGVILTVTWLLAVRLYIHANAWPPHELERIETVAESWLRRRRGRPRAARSWGCGRRRS